MQQKLAGLTPEYRAIYDKIDTNNDGVLQVSEIRKALGQTVQASLIDKLVKLSDADGNGVIDQVEFVSFVQLLKTSKVDIRDKVQVD